MYIPEKRAGKHVYGIEVVKRVFVFKEREGNNITEFEIDDFFSYFRLLSKSIWLALTKFVCM